MTDAREFDLELDMLSAYLDGELTNDERTAVEARLTESAEWRAELGAVQSARSIVRALRVREAPAGFWDRVIEHVESAGVDDVPVAAEAMPAPVPITSSTADRRSTRVGRPARWLAGAAAAAVALVVVVALPDDNAVKPDITAVATQHGANTSESGDPISGLAGVGPLLGLRQ